MNFLSSIQTKLIAALGVLLALLAGLAAAFKAGGNKERLKSTEKARETEQKATEELVGGLQRENNVVDAALARRRARFDKLRDSGKPEAPPTTLDS